MPRVQLAQATELQGPGPEGSEQAPLRIPQAALQCCMRRHLPELPMLPRHCKQTQL